MIRTEELKGERMDSAAGNKKVRLVPANIFLAVALANIVILIIALVYTGGSFLSEVVWDARNPLFCDFWTHVGRVRGGRNPYIIEDWDARFPPLAYLFYYFLSCIIPEQIINSGLTDWYNLYMVIVLCVCLVCITLAVREQLHRSYIYMLGFMLVFVLSHTFALAEIKAGNSATYVLAMLVTALYLKDSDSKAGREAALILIAMAAGFKMSPAIFGFVYIKEKRYKEAARLVIYGLICFLAPFAMFGGIDGLKVFLEISSMVSNATNPRPETIVGVVIEIFVVLGLGEGIGLAAGNIVSYIYLALCLFLLFKCKYSWKTLWLISSLMIILVNQSGPYTLQYLLIPLIAFVNETDLKHNRMDMIYAVLFALILTTWPFLRIDWPTATFITNYFWVYVFVIILLIDLFKGVFSHEED